MSSPRFVARFGAIARDGITWHGDEEELHGASSLADAGGIAVHLLSSSGTASWRWPAPGELVGRVGTRVVRVRQTATS